jgi:hypothetical protein
VSVTIADDMKTPAHRIALAALILLVLAVIGAWWWEHPTVEQTISPDDPANALPGEVAMARPVRASPQVMSAAGDAEQCSIAMLGAFNVRARELAQRDDANSQLAYALAMPYETPADFERTDPVAMKRIIEKRLANEQRAFIHAAELAPSRPDIMFLAAARCWGGDICRGVQKALLEAQPDNMAVWLYEMGWASGRNDPDASARAFERAGQATRNDTYADSALHVLVEAYGGMPMPVECSSDAAKAVLRRQTGMDQDFSMLDQALVLASASRAGTLPAYNEIRLRCKPQPSVAMGATTRASCRDILTKMADGDSWIGRLIALGTMVQLAADDSDASAWRERYRGDRWMMAQLGSSDIQRLLQPEDYWIDEARSLQAALEASGRWPPPADWLPNDELARSLIQTGPPPPQKKR